MSVLEKINSPSDVKKLTGSECVTLASDIRKRLVEVVSKTGGHLASNLGVVELTIALHRVFSSPQDSLIWDVGHQCYVHKMLTGRNKELDTLRAYNGISGFTKRSESAHDPFGAGHSGTSVSAAAGIATANKIKGKKGCTVAIVGDGAFAGGMIYEALNDCADRDLNLIVVLNENEMSISENVGGMSTYLSKIKTSEKYYNLKRNTEKAFNSIPLVGTKLTKGAKQTKDFFKRMVVSDNLFENLGWVYLGVADGNDISKVETVLREAKKINKCCIVHVRTKKGKGYLPAEKNPCAYHGVSPFDAEKGILKSSNGKKSFSKVFGDEMCRLAAKDERICAVTAAMAEGTCLDEFGTIFPKRFFDVGIAEEHAATFCAALSAKGLKPVFAVYSTFAQRAYDQIIHDAALQGLPVVFALDRAGLTPSDGPTHHGVFDVSFFESIPNTEIYSPETYIELTSSLKYCLDSDKVSAVRYPKDVESDYDRSGFVTADENGYIKYCDYGDNIKTCIVTYGRVTKNVCKAAEKLAKDGIGVRVIKIVKLKPLCYEDLYKLTEGKDNLFFVEEGIKTGGFSESTLCRMMLDKKCSFKNIDIRAIDGFVPHGDIARLFKDIGLDEESIYDMVAKCIQ